MLHSSIICSCVCIHMCTYIHTHMQKKGAILQPQVERMRVLINKLIQNMSCSMLMLNAASYVKQLHFLVLFCCLISTTIFLTLLLCHLDIANWPQQTSTCQMTWEGKQSSGFKIKKKKNNLLNRFWHVP